MLKLSLSKQLKFNIGSPKVGSTPYSIQQVAYKNAMLHSRYHSGLVTSRLRGKWSFNITLREKARENKWVHLLYICVCAYVSLSLIDLNDL